MLDLHAKPYYLSDEDIKWVEDTLSSLTLKEKVGQMFHAVFAGTDDEALMSLYEKIPFGGVTFRANTSDVIKRQVDRLQHSIRIPALVSANLENGGAGVATDGTEYASQIEVAATEDTKYAYALGDICGSEGAACGCNYSFAPVCDVMFNWRNPIINTRTYGSNPEKTLEFAREYFKGIKKHGFIVSCKHFPGDGVDERDQHLLSSVNSLTKEEWDASFGMIYSGMIDEGIQTVMVGHILLPAYARFFNPDIKDSEIRPASLSKDIVTGLLKGKLGFNGAVITDSASMAGLGCALPRREIPTACINAGCDMFLFGRNMEEDFNSLLEDAENGVITEERINDAVRRILGIKASIGLHNKTEFTAPDPKKIVGCKEHRKLAKECADKAITLVKDTQKLLPLDVKKTKRVWLCPVGDVPYFRGGMRSRELFKAEFEKHGFEVTMLDVNEYISAPVSELKKKYDVMVYIGNMVYGGNNTTNRISWYPKACGEAPQLVNDIPTVYISVGNPYDYVDVPMVKTIINCYDCSKEIIESVVEKVVGESEFCGKSPVDPFNGYWGAAL